MTAAFARLFSEGLGSGIGEGIRSGAAAALRVAAGVAGKIWALPNTVIGIAAGLVASIPTLGGAVYFGNNAIQFRVKLPFGEGGAITFGNVITYDRTNPGQWANLYGDPRLLNLGLHEQAHKYQYQFFGPFFMPAYVLSGGGFTAANPFEQAANDYAAGGSWWPY